MAMIDLDARDIGRLLVGVRSRIGKLEKGIARFGDDFDPEKGKNMIASLEAHKSLKRRLIEAQNECNDAGH